MSSDEFPEDPLHAALVQFTGCVGEAVEDVCSYGLTLGETYVPFMPDPPPQGTSYPHACDGLDEGILCSQLWVRVASVAPGQVNQGWEGDCAVSLVATIEVGIERCFVIPEGGEAPTATDVMRGALQAMTDMKAIHCAAVSCDAWDRITTGQWSPLGPQGGQYGGVWTFTVTLD